MLTLIGFPGGIYYIFEYNSWGQVTNIRHYGSAQRNYTSYYYPAVSFAPQTDCPRFTQRTDWAYDWNTGVQSTYPAFDPTAAWGSVTLPDGTIYKEHYSTSGWQKGLSDATEFWSDSVKKKWTATTWTQDNTSVSYPLNPRVTETNIYDDVNGNGTFDAGVDNRRRTAVSYTTFSLPSSATCNLPYDVTEYAADASTVLRTSRTTYKIDSQADSAYLSRHIIGLPWFQYLYQGVPGSGGTLSAKVEYLYDGGSVPAPAPSPSPTPVQHDESGYSPSLTAGRGNLTGMRRYDVTGSATNYVESQTGYNTTGAATYQREPNPSSGVTHQVNFSYTDAFSDAVNRNTYAYPTSVTDADGKVSTMQYDFAWGLMTRTQDPKGAVVTRTYDGAGRPDHVTNQVNSAYTRYVYASDLNSVSTFTTIKDATTEFYTITLMDGMNRVRAVVKDHPGSTGGYSSVYNAYDTMGRLVQQSNPTEIDGNWTPAGDDVYVANPPNGGYVWNQQAYDWKGRPTVTTNADGTTRQASYAGCGCAGGETVTLTDEVGRQQKIYHDVLGRVVKTETYNGSTVYATTTTTYNVRDQVTQVLQQAGSSGTGQTTTMTYDGHGRLSTKQLPIFLGTPQSATHAYLSYEYYDDDTLMKVTDPRGAYSNFSYNGRHLVTSLSYGAPSGITVPPSVSFTYDDAGNRLTMTESGTGATGSVSYAYDTQSRMTSETRTLTGLSGSFKFNYQYNVGGQLTQISDERVGVTDTAFGTVTGYSYDKAGRLSGVTGSGPTSTAQYVSSLQYRAWDAAKHIGYGNSVASDFTFNVRLQPTNYTLSNVVQGVGQPTNLSYDYTYYDDARMLHFSDNANHIFDRKYEYDHLGRLKEAYSGREANGQSPTTPRDNPYRQTYTYDEWDNLTGRNGAFWRQSLQDASTYDDAHGRRQGWGYDEAGQVLHDDTGDHFYDARGSQGLFQNWKYFVGGGETGHPQAPGAEIEQSYDGQGQVVKRVETKRTETPHDPNDPNNPLTDIATNVTTTYDVRSSVLGGAAVLELAGSGNKSKGHVYAGAGELARQVTTSTTPLVSAVIWQQGTPGTGSWVETNDTRFAQRMEMDPVGAEVGTSDPFVTDPTPSYLEMRGDRPLYVDGGDPFDLSGGCTLDGLPVPCSFAAAEANGGAAAMVTGTPKSIFDVFVAHADGSQGWLPNTARVNSSGAWYDPVSKTEGHLKPDFGFAFGTMSLQQAQQKRKPTPPAYVAPLPPGILKKPDTTSISKICDELRTLLSREKTWGTWMASNMSKRFGNYLLPLESFTYVKPVQIKVEYN